MGFLGKTKSKFLYGGGVMMFIRSSISAQIASWIDMASSIGLVAAGLSQWVATPIGAIFGGIVNCCINYKFTFRSSGCSVKAVAVKYLLIWIGSVAFNTIGTSLLADAFDSWNIMERLGFTTVGSFAAARIVVSLVVSLAWNFLMQKHFVYRSRPGFDPYADRLVDGLMWIVPRKTKNNKE